MKRIILFLTVVLLAAVAVHAQDNEPKGPEIKFGKAVHDFDTIAKDSDGECWFEFENTGSEPLIITSAFSSCGCTVPTWPKEPILPGAKNSIKVKYNTGQTGPFTKVIVVKSNAITNKKAILRIKGVVKE